MTLRAITNCKWQAPGKKESKRERQHSRVQIALTESEETRTLDLAGSICDDCKRATKLLGASVPLSIEQ